VSKEVRPQARVAGFTDQRLDGIIDLLVRAGGMSVLDVGCNRGKVCFDFFNNGARIVHGCDIDSDSIKTARNWFVDLRAVKSQFEVVDLRCGPAALKPFGDGGYDIVTLLATYHKLKRQMDPALLSELMRHLGRRTIRWFAWRGTSHDHSANFKEMKKLDGDLGDVGLKRIHTSHMSDELGIAAIWKRQ